MNEMTKPDQVKATIVVEGTFREGYQDHFNEYSQKVKDILNKFEAIVIRRQLISETLYGQEKPSLIMVIDFPDKEIAQKAFFTEQYISIIPLRDKVFKTFKMYLADFGNV